MFWNLGLKDLGFYLTLWACPCGPCYPLQLLAQSCPISKHYNRTVLWGFRCTRAKRTDEVITHANPHKNHTLAFQPPHMKKQTLLLLCFILLKFVLQYTLIGPQYELHRDEYL